MMEWEKGAQHIRKFTNKDGRQINLIGKYSQIDVSTLTTDCKPIIFAIGIDTDKWAAQNHKQMWDCLSNSLKEDAKAKFHA